MRKWHVNDAGNVGRCSVKTGSCPFGGESGEDNHYATKEEAYKAYEVRNKALTVSNGLSKLKKRTFKLAAVGGVLLASTSLTACDSNIGFDDNGDVEISVGGEKIDLSDYTDTDDSGSDDGGYSDSSSSQGGSDAVIWQGHSLQPSQEEIDEAKSELNKLTIADEISRPDYNRDEMFGPFESGVVEHIQARDLPHAEFGSTDKANGGYMMDAYSGERVELSAENRSDIDTEHIVPLKEVTESERIVINTDSEAEAIKQDPQLLNDYVAQGESNLTDAEIQSIENNPDSLDDYYLDSSEKESIANSDDNLTMVSSSENRSKGDKDPAEWLPSYEPTQCTYAVSTLKVKTEYNLTADQAESDALKDVLDNKCS